MKRPSSEQIAAVGFRKVIRPEPEILPACRNCTHFIYDADDREGWKGITFRRINLQCRLHRFGVTLDSICNLHGFRHADRRDA
jgi:hypothetical protein